jgi:pimeloyl-ACP methyl ester carboxylesterase
MRVVAVVLAVFPVVAAVAGDAYLTDLAAGELSNDGFERWHKWVPADFHLEALNVTFESAGRDLAGWWIPAPNHSGDGPLLPPSPAAILVHGHSANMGKVVARWAPHLHELGLNVLAFDLRNHGASDDTANGRVAFGVDEADDVLAAVRFVRAHAAELGADGERIVLYGASMGAVAVLHAAAQHPAGVVAVVADSAFASLEYQAQFDGAADGYPPWLIRMVLQRMDRLADGRPVTASRAEEVVAHVEVPLLLAHCANDARLTPTSLPRIAARADGAIVWSEECRYGISATRHVDGYATAGYNATVAGLLGPALAAADAR